MSTGRTHARRWLGWTLVAVIGVASIRFSLPLLAQPLAHHLTFMPSALDVALARPERWGISDAQVVHIPSTDGVVLYGWWIAARHGWSDQCGTALILHGNMGNITSQQSMAMALADRGMDVFLFDYRGYGLSSGRPTARGVYDDALAAYRYVRTVRGVPPNRLLLAGHSLGSAIAVHLAASEPAAGLILAAPWSSIPSAIQAHLPWVPAWLLPRGDDRFASIDVIGKVHMPILMALGTHDRLIPRADARRLFQAASTPKTWVDVHNAGHNDMLVSSDLWRAIDRFLQDNYGCGAAAPRPRTPVE